MRRSVRGRLRLCGFSWQGYPVLRKVVEETLPALEDTGAGEATLSEILARGLEKDRTRRFQAMHDLRAALAQWLDDRGERQAEDLHGRRRLSQSWRIAAAPTELLSYAISEPSIAAETRRKRFALVPRFALAAAIAFAAIAIPSKLAVESAQAEHRVVPEIAVVSDRPAPQSGALIAVANVDPIALTSSIARRRPKS